MPDSWQACLSALRANTILKNEVATALTPATHLALQRPNGRDARGSAGHS